MFFKKKKVMNVKTYGAQVLKKHAKKVDKIDDEIRELADSMLDTMRAFDGIGLAGPQVGAEMRIVAFGVPMRQPDCPTPPTPGELLLLPRMPFVVINPEIISSSSELESADEGCLSVPEIYAPVTRPALVMFRAVMVETGEVINVECGGLLGRCIQHELDHLDGKLFVDRLTEEDKKRVLAELQALKKRGEKNNFSRKM